MWITTVSVYNPEDTKVAEHILVKVDRMGDRAVFEHNRAFASDYRELYSVATLSWESRLIQQGDVLVDEQMVDPSSGASYRYRVEYDPRNHHLSHQEFKAATIPGTE